MEQLLQLSEELLHTPSNRMTERPTVRVTSERNLRRAVAGARNPLVHQVVRQLVHENAPLTVRGELGRD